MSLEQNLQVLRAGGAVQDAAGRSVTLPAASDLALQTHLDEVAQAWVSFRVHLQPVDPLAVQAESPQLLTLLDTLAGELEARAQAKLVWLQSVQFIFVLAALLLLVWGYLVTEQWLIRPLATLGTAARRLVEQLILAGALDGWDIPHPAGNKKSGCSNREPLIIR